MIVFTIINLIILIANIVYTVRPKYPKWEYYKEGIRFYNKNNEVTIEYEKPLK